VVEKRLEPLILSMSKISMKQNCKPLLKCRWPATNQNFQKTEESFENWTTLRKQNCHQNQ